MSDSLAKRHCTKWTNDLFSSNLCAPAISGNQGSPKDKCADQQVGATDSVVNPVEVDRQPSRQCSNITASSLQDQPTGYDECLRGAYTGTNNNSINLNVNSALQVSADDDSMALSTANLQHISKNRSAYSSAWSMEEIMKDQLRSDNSHSGEGETPGFQLEFNRKSASNQNEQPSRTPVLAPNLIPGRSRSGLANDVMAGAKSSTRLTASRSVGAREQSHNVGSTLLPPSEDLEETFLCVFYGKGRLGAAAYNTLTCKLSLFNDMPDAPPYYKTGDPGTH